MKAIYTILVALLFVTFQLKAQAPDQFNYQGVARDASGNVLPNQNIGIRFTIHEGSAGGTTVYRETQSATTNQFGLFTVALGSGAVVSGTFTSIAWGSNTEYLQLEIDPTGGSTYINMGTHQFLSVPYALYAASSGNGGSAGWGLTGNAATSAGTNFIGTTDANDLVIKTNGVEDLRVTSAGSVRDAGLATGGSFIITPSAATDKILFTNATGDIQAITPGAANTVLTLNASGIPTWSTSASTLGWQLTGNATSAYTFNASPTTFVGTTASGGTGFQFGLVGTNAGRVESANFGNTALGYQSLNSVTAPGANTALGYQTLKNNTGTFNTGVGYLAFGNLASSGGNYNTGIGYQALLNNSGSANTAVGSGALNGPGLLGIDNVGIGQYALGSNTTGSKNTGIGWNTNVGSGTLSNATAIGAEASVSQSNSLVLGAISGVNGASSNTNVGIGTSSPNSALQVVGGVSYPLITTTASLLLTNAHYTVVITGGNPAITLPAAAGNTGRIYVLVNETASPVTISSYQDLNGTGSTAIPVHSSISIQTDGANWYQVR